MATPTEVAHVPTAIAFFDEMTGLGTGSTGPSDNSGSIWRTRNGGESWTAEALPKATLRVITVIPGTAMAWAGAACGEVDAPCYPGIMASSDGGATWKRVSNEAVVSLWFPDTSHGWAVSPREPNLAGPVGGMVGSLLFSGDGGRSWTNRANPCRFLGMAPVSVTFPKANDGWIACGSSGGAGRQDKSVLATTDGGDTWRVRALASAGGMQNNVGRITDSGYFDGLAMRADGRGFAWMDRAGTFRTEDGGRTWAAIPPGSSDTRSVTSAWLITDTDWFVVLFDHGDGTQKLERSRNAGGTWEVVANWPFS